MSSSPKAPARVTSTGAPQRNFDLPAEERVRAAVSGPPAFVRRLRAIEDLEEAIVRGLVTAVERARAEGLDPSQRMRDGFPAAAHRTLGDLVRSHNRYYPIEANLPMSLRTGELVDRDGAAWRPRPCPSMEELIARAATRASAAG